MSVLTPRPPGPPRHDEPPDLEALEALIEEARRRARRRRLYGACAIVIAAAGLAAYFGFNDRGSASDVADDRPPTAPRLAPQEASKPTAGIEGGSIHALAVDPLSPETLFAAGLDAGVFKSVDGGVSWRPLTIAHDATRVDALAIAPGDPQTVYVGTGGGVFKSTDGGATWQAADGGLFDEETAGERDHRRLEGYVYSLVVDPRDSETVYAGTWEQGLLKTTNGGASWQRLGPGSIGAIVLGPHDPETIYVGSVGAAVGGGSGSGVSKSADGGRTWQPVGLVGTNVGSLAIDPKDPQTLYAGTAKGLLKTSDGGKNWRAVGLKGWGWLSGVKIDPENSAILYAATTTGAFKSTDGGGSWVALDAAREPHYGVNVLAFDPRSSATVYAGTGAGVFKSTDSGRSWKVSTSGMSAARVEDLVAATRNSAYALVDSQGFFRRSPGGWRPANTGLPTLDLSVMAVDPQRPKTVYVATGAEIFTTTNGGESWRGLQAPATSETTEISGLAVDPQNSKILYAGMSEWGDYFGTPIGVFKSTDGGASWRALSRGMPPPGDPSVLAIDPLDSQTVYAATHGVFKSSDGGGTWESPAEDFRVDSFALDPSKPTTMYAGADGKVFKSTNRGATWRDLHAGFGTGSLAIDPLDSQTVYAGGDDGLFVSNDGGDTWRRYQGDLGKWGIEALAIDPTGHTLYVGGIRNGVAEVSLSGR